MRAKLIFLPSLALTGLMVLALGQPSLAGDKGKGKKAATMKVGDKAPMVEGIDDQAVNPSKFTGEFTDDDPRDKGFKKSPHKVYKLELKKGQGVVIRLQSSDFDSYLRLEDSTGKELAANDDESPNTLNSKLTFIAKNDDTYQIVATIFDGPGAKTGYTGKYTLTIEAKPWKSADVVGKKVLVLFFFPAALTGG